MCSPRQTAHNASALKDACANVFPPLGASSSLTSTTLPLLGLLLSAEYSRSRFLGDANVDEELVCCQTLSSAMSFRILTSLRMLLPDARMGRESYTTPQRKFARGSAEPTNAPTDPTGSVE